MASAPAAPLGAAVPPGLRIVVNVKELLTDGLRHATIECVIDDTLLSLNTKVYTTTGIPIEDQRFMFGGKLLEDTDPARMARTCGYGFTLQLREPRTSAAVEAARQRSISPRHEEQWKATVAASQAEAARLAIPAPIWPPPRPTAPATVRFSLMSDEVMATMMATAVAPTAWRPPAATPYQRTGFGTAPPVRTTSSDHTASWSPPPRSPPPDYEALLNAEIAKTAASVKAFAAMTARLTVPCTRCHRPVGHGGHEYCVPSCSRCYRPIEHGPHGEGKCSPPVPLPPSKGRAGAFMFHASSGRSMFAPLAKTPADAATKPVFIRPTPIVVESIRLRSTELRITGYKVVGGYATRRECDEKALAEFGWCDDADGMDSALEMLARATKVADMKVDPLWAFNPCNVDLRFKPSYKLNYELKRNQPQRASPFGLDDNEMDTVADNWHGLAATYTQALHGRVGIRLWSCGKAIVNWYLHHRHKPKALMGRNDSICYPNGELPSQYCAFVEFEFALIEAAARKHDGLHQLEAVKALLDHPVLAPPLCALIVQYVSF